MLHVRVVSPAALTGRLTDTLATAPGVRNVVVETGAGHRPDGDVVQFDVRDETANFVFGGLRDLGLDRAGVICVQRVDAAISDGPSVTGEHVSIAFSSWTEAWGSTLQLLLNVAVLIVVGAAGLSTQRRIWRWRTGPPRRRSAP